MPIILKKPDTSITKHLPDFTNPAFLKHSMKAAANLFDFKFGSFAKDLIEVGFSLRKIEDPGVQAYLLISQALINSCRDLVKQNDHLYKGKTYEGQLEVSSVFTELNNEFQDELEGMEIEKSLFSSPEKEISIHQFQEKLWKRLEEMEVLSKNHAQNLAFQLTQLFPRHLEAEWEAGDYNLIKDKLLGDDLFFESRRYRQAHIYYQQRLLSEYTDIVLNDSAGMTLADIYIEPYVKAFRKCWTDDNKVYNNEPFILVTQKNNENPLSVHNVIYNWLIGLLPSDELISHKSKVALLFGQPGQGKTSFVKRLANDLILPNTPYPWSKKVFLIKLRNFEKEEVIDLMSDPEKYLQDKLNSRLPFKRHTLEYEDFGKSVLILDGLDELKMKENLKQEIVQEFLEKLKRLTGNPDFDLHIIITSRKGTVDPEKLNAGDFLTLQLEGLDKDQQDQWLSTYRKFHPKHKGITHRKLKEIRKEEHFSYLKELIEQPILLYLIAKSEIFPSHDINRSKIYQELFDQLIERAWDEGQIPALKNIAKEDLREFLGDIALKIWQSPNEYITKKSLASLAKANGPFAGSNEDLGFLLKQVMVSFYFRSVPKDVEDGSEDTSRDAIEFLHKSLMEYLAAEKIWGEIKYLEEKTNKGRKYAIETSTKALSHLFPIVASKIFHQEEEKVDDYLLELIRADGSNNHELSERLVLFLPGLLKLSFIDISQSNSLEISLLHQGSNTFFNYWNVMEAVRESCGEASRQLNLPQVYYDFAHSFRTYTAFQPSKLLLKGWRFKRLYLSGSQFKSSELENIKFTDSALEGVNMYSSNLVDVNFYRAQMNASNFTSVNAFRINFDFATLGFCSFRFSNITEVSFHESYLGNTSFDAANLSNVNFNYANLIGATFHKTNISDVDFSYAELDGVDLSRANMKGISLKGASLKNAYLRAINFNGVLADESKFINSYLREGKLKSASLKKVDFEGADLSKVDFKDAKLEGANFKGANLYLANFQSADLYRAKGLTVLQLMEVDSLRGVIGLDPDIEESIRKRKGYLFS